MNSYWKKWYKTIFEAIKWAFVALLSFSRSLAEKGVFLNNQPYVTRPNVIG